MFSRGKTLPTRLSSQPVVEKDLIHDQRQAVFATQCCQCVTVRWAREVSCGIVRVNDHDGPGVGRHAATQRIQVQMPAMIVKELIGHQPHIVQPGQKIKERVARLADQHLVAGIAEQAEEEAVRLAGASSENDLLRIDSRPMIAVIQTDGLTRQAKTPWIRFVEQSKRVVERGKNRLRIVSEAALGWI